MSGRTRTFLISGGIAALSFFLISPAIAERLPPALAPYATKIGEALLVGIVVSLAVDRFLKADLFAEIARDVLRFTVGYELPEEIRHEIRHLLRLPFVRRNFEMTLEISRAEERSDAVYVRMSTRFEVENLAKRAHEYTFTSSIQRSPLPELAPSAIESVEVTGRGGFKLQRPAIGASITSDEHFHRFSRRVVLSGREAAPHVFSTVRKTIFLARDVYVLDILEPTVNVTIRIHAPAGFRCSVYFPVQGETERSPDSVVHAHKGVFLPGQFVRISWDGTPALSPAAARH